MDSRLKSAVCRLEVARADGETERGTGFLIADRWVLTALHVVADTDVRPVAWRGPIQAHFFNGETVAATPVEGWLDPDTDWVVLEVPPQDVEPLAWGEGPVVGAEWSSFGYALPRGAEGMAFAGTVRDADARSRGVVAYQLFSEDAAAGRGTPVEGLSGAPVVVDGCVVGIVRTSLVDALDDPRRTLAGTLFACPLSCVSAVVGDQLPSLTPLPADVELPASPFPGLRWFGPEERAVFFGRGREEAELRRLLTGDGAPVVLLYGPSGVGKSSLLGAGVGPTLPGWRPATCCTCVGCRSQRR